VSASENFRLDPLEGRSRRPDEPAFTRYLGKLPDGQFEFRMATGRTEFLPAGPLVVGCCYDIAIAYFPEEAPLPPGTRVAFSIPQTWTQPCAEPERPGAVRVERSRGGLCSLELTESRNLGWWIVARVEESAEPPEGWIRIHYSAVSIQRFPQDRYINWRANFQVVVNTTGQNDYAVVRAARTQKPVIRAAPPARFHVAGPSLVRAGKTVAVRFVALDYCDNRAVPPPEGEVFAASHDDPFKPLARLSLSAADNGHGELAVPVPTGVRNVRIAVSDCKDRLRGFSPLMVVTPLDASERVFFGDIHAKTELTDGLKTPRGYYAHARDVALNDFSAITDHNSSAASRAEGPFVHGLSDDAFAAIQAATEDFNAPGRFVTLQGFEQDFIEGYRGHRNLYFRGRCPGLFRGRTLADLYDYLEGHRALVIPHHHMICAATVHLGNPRYERLVEMYSMHGTSETRGTPLSNKVEDGVSARELLAAGHRVGFIAASDNHNGAPGLSARSSRFTNLVYSGGLAAVWAAELTREAVFDALYARRCYGTTGARILLDFRLNGEPMGSELRLARGQAAPCTILAAGTDHIVRVELIRNGTEELLWNGAEDLVRLDRDLRFDGPEWLYVRVTQADRQMAWSSPIWITPEEP
jgi:hypothetical protein